MDDSHSFTDLQHVTHLSTQDYELFPDSACFPHPVIHQRTAEIQRQLSLGDHAIKTPWFPSRPLSNPRMRLDQMDASHSPDVGIYPMMPDISLPFGRGPLSPGAESLPSNGGSWWNVGDYMSPPSSCADSMLPSLDHWDPSSPVTPANLDASVAPTQIVPNYPIPIPIAEPEPDLDFKLEPSGENESTPACNLHVAQHGVLDDTDGTLSCLETTHAADRDFITSPRHPPLAATKRPGPKRGARSKGGMQKGSAKKETTRRTTCKAKTRKNTRPQRTFVCSFSRYGCNSSFASKNEWKRHVTSQHLQLGFYRCDVGQCNLNSLNKNGALNTANDFNRKDLFTQHQRRMHAPWPSLSFATEEEKQQFDAGLETVRHRCWRDQRQAPPRSQCGFCGEEFVGPQSWNQRMEHVGRHYEKGNPSLNEENEDIALRDWAVYEGILRQADGGWRLASHCEK
ncbi:hypothetical protein BDV28DRAFT_12925 [Aspergillus coremiiformis]|uniref:C2H2 finger domain protein n=1 Tax=Aspergillus coremiiformis TaxID=138285 RepID=A0A5N6Z2E6_9EURO|nr:hypothetical protein BDV28DRAFT_12925 [Aspergillus coremiiformis]